MSKTTTVTIYHNKHVVTPDNRTRGNDSEGDHFDGCLGPFFDFCAGCIARAQYVYTVTGSYSFDQIYEDNQNGIEEITGKKSYQEHAGIQARSLSVGDVIVKVEAFDDGRRVQEIVKVANMGFVPIDEAMLASAAMKEPQPGFVIR